MEKPQKNNLRDRALRLLARREHTRVELAQKLSRYAEEQDDLEALIDDLAQTGLVSDQRFAEHFIAAKQKRFGHLKIAYELKAKGLDADSIKQLTVASREQEIDAAREVWQRKFPSPPANSAEKAKQMRFLQGRGFSNSTIYRLFKVGEE
jgi:regulatory protein